MVVLNSGLKVIRKFLVNNSDAKPPTGIMLGTDGTVADETQTWLGSEVSSTEKGFSVVPVETDFTIQYEHTLSSVEGNGFAFKEFILMDSVMSSAFTRDTFTTINKTQAFETQTLITIKILNEE
jgi:hypothetical protein